MYGVTSKAPIKEGGQKPLFKRIPFLMLKRFFNTPPPLSFPFQIPAWEFTHRKKVQILTACVVQALQQNFERRVRFSSPSSHSSCGQTATHSPRSPTVGPCSSSPCPSLSPPTIKPAGGNEWTKAAQLCGSSGCSKTATTPGPEQYSGDGTKRLPCGGWGTAARSRGRWQACFK